LSGFFVKLRGRAAQAQRYVATLGERSHMRVLKNFLRSITGKILLAATVFLLLGYWWVHGYVWFRIDNSHISINGRSLAEGSDYSCFRSMSGDIFCYHQDHGTQYFISPRKNEVSTIDERVDVEYLEGVIISGGARDGFDGSDMKHRLPETSLIRGNGFVEFAPPVTEVKGSQIERWHITY
jgi:hypothetical protein